MQPRILFFNDYHSDSIKTDRRLERHDERFKDFGQIQMAARGLSYIKYELGTGLNCVSHLWEEYHGPIREVVRKRCRAAESPISFSRKAALRLNKKIPFLPRRAPLFFV